MSNAQLSTTQPLEQLDEADREFVIRFVLASGSLKDVAAGYGVSYPTIRARLDKVIARLEELRRGQPISPVKEVVADLLAKGELSESVARKILAQYQKEKAQFEESRT